MVEVVDCQVDFYCRYLPAIIDESISIADFFPPNSLADYFFPPNYWQVDFYCRLTMTMGIRDPNPTPLPTSTISHLSQSNIHYQWRLSLAVAVISPRRVSLFGFCWSEPMPILLASLLRLGIINRVDVADDHHGSLCKYKYNIQSQRYRPKMISHHVVVSHYQIPSKRIFGGVVVWGFTTVVIVGVDYNYQCISTSTRSCRLGME